MLTPLPPTNNIGLMILWLNLNLQRLDTVVSAAPYCVFYALRHQI